MSQKIAFPGQPAAARIASFLQNIGQQIINQTYGGAYEISLAAGQTFLLPAGEWLTQLGPYSDLQYWDAQSQMWRNLIGQATAPIPISCDGTNYRYSNTTGCPVGAVVTNTGTTLGASYPVTMFAPNGTWVGGTFTPGTPNFVATPSAGASTWNAFIGGAINTSVTITGGGTLYSTAPKLLIVPPANQGAQPFIPATATCTISGGVINAVTVTNQGAGYVAAPTILVLNQPGDTTGSGAVLTPALTGAGQLICLTQATPGTAQTAVPTLAFSGSAVPASAAATALMNFTILAGGTPTAGSGYTNGYSLKPVSGPSLATAIYTNPAIEKGINFPAEPIIYNNSATVVAVTAAMITFGGTDFQLAPSLGAIGIGTGGGITTCAVGGTSDMSLLYPI
jgi:hypothetical protein